MTRCAVQAGIDEQTDLDHFVCDEIMEIFVYSRHDN